MIDIVDTRFRKNTRLKETNIVNSLRKKIGQLLICGFEGYKISPELEEMIVKYSIGGIILFKRNVQSVEQIKNLNLELQTLNAPHNDSPLLISMDQEGGGVARIESGITYLPGAMALAAAVNAQTYNVTAIYQAEGAELRALGINMNLAPVADVNNNANNPVINIRSFGEDPARVSAYVTAAIEGLEKAQVASVAKHFPGHGDTAVDSHLGLPRIDHSKERLENIELSPFYAAIEKGVPAIMTAHIVIPSFDANEVPATLSKPILTDLLREKMGFRGVIMTDCLEMEAISTHYGVVEGAVQAFKAGADLLLISHTKKHQIGFIKTMMQKVENGEISETRIDESIARIQALKTRYHMDQYVIDAPLEEESASALSRELTTKSITLVKDDHTLLPIDPILKTLVLTFSVQNPTEIDAVMTNRSTLGTYLQTALADCKETFLQTSPTEEEIKEIWQETEKEKYQQIIIASYNAKIHPTQATLIQKLAEEHYCTIVVATRMPYDIASFPNVSTYLASYDNNPHALKSVAQVLLGKEAQGNLPVTL